MAQPAVHQFDLFATTVAHRVFVNAWDAHARRQIPADCSSAVLHAQSGQGAPFRYIARTSWAPGRFEAQHPDGRMPADRTRGDIRTTRAGGYHASGSDEVLEVGRDEAAVFVLLPPGADLAPLEQLTTPVVHRQQFTAVTPDQAIGTIVECFCAQGHAHRLRRELLAAYPTAGVGVYQQDMSVHVADVQRAAMVASRAQFA